MSRYGLSILISFWTLAPIGTSMLATSTVQISLQNWAPLDQSGTWVWTASVKSAPTVTGVPWSGALSNSNFVHSVLCGVQRERVCGEWHRVTGGVVVKKEEE